MALTLFYFILTLILLINVHEFGHFIVARACGVKVLRFSFGFGKVLACWRDKRGTEFVWSLFPLGGYVKMLDETEGEVLADEHHLAFNNQSVWVRMAIIVAGPLFNFIFAFLALWLVLVIGMHSLAPIIDDVQEGSIAAQAGLRAKQEILSLNNKKIASWNDFYFALMPLLGSDTPIKLTVKYLKSNQSTHVFLPLIDWHLNKKTPDVLKTLGITPFIPRVPAIIGEVTDASPAQVAGLKPEDEITTVNGKPLVDWFALVNFVKQHPAQKIVLGIVRQAQMKTLAVQIGSEMHQGKMLGFLGVRSKQVDWPAHWLRLQRKAALPAIPLALTQTLELMQGTFTLIKRVALGKLSIENISGPVGIAQGAGQSARNGLPSYLFFLALISISLGVLNLLPIPMLDGGHLLFCIIEVVRKRPVSAKIKSQGIYLGLILLIILMGIGFTNDLARLFG